MRISDWSSDVCSSDLRRHGRHLPAGRRRRSVRPSFTDLKKRDGSMTAIATLSDLERLVEERAIERVLSDYAYYLDMNMPDRMAELCVEAWDVDYAPTFGAEGNAAYKHKIGRAAVRGRGLR